MKYDLSAAFERRDDLHEWKCQLLIHALSAMSDDVVAIVGERPIVLDVKLTINAREVAFDTFVEHLRKEYERLVNLRAQELVLERANTLLESLETLRHHVDDKTKEMFAESAPLAPATFGASTPWPLSDAVAKLVGAVDHLLKDHNCDAHGWEEVGHARDAANAWLARLAEVKVKP